MSEKPDVEYWLALAESFIDSWRKDPSRDGLYSSFKLRRAEGCLIEASKLVESD